ncbi:hypothetical protein [Tengunoibacter tsumagoiensis]|uniref:Uncharacterized protein n=1 Tax=Tengunoibacter tsumagoiensis TaxID=2014871 RepID=A0A401ZYV2_9CHLR|nr:hypothetical protein [Tengunoibacter tsumagoiensis]GCE12034.1 hypothetical protein KTT_18930 [Tengunoibacter tsumagoiensis]
MTTNQSTKKERRREELRRREAERQRAIRRQKRLLTTIITAIVAAIVLVVVLYIRFFFVATPAAQSPTTPTPQVAITPVSDNPAYGVIDNIACSSSEQLTYHIHAHLSIFINGKAVPVAENIGIAPDQSCIYWMHTHDTSGIIHMEAPQTDTFKLGTFLQVWHDHFSQLQFPSQLASTTGWQVYVNGKAYTGDFKQIELKSHTMVTLAYNSPTVQPETTFNWGLLNE